MFTVAPDLSMVPRFGVAGWTVVLVTIGYLVVLTLRGRRALLMLQAARPTDPAALVTFYRRNVTRKIGLLPPVALLLLVVPGLRPAQLGLAWPHGPSARGALGHLAYLAVFILITGLWWRRSARRGEPVPRPRRLEILVPATGAERRWAWAVSISAGVCEELVFRGLLITAGIAAGWSPLVAAMASSVLFGMAHLYQGWLGMLLTAVLGQAMAYFYLPTGSLLIPIVLHTLIDLRGLVMVPAVATSPEPVQRDSAG
ncbi:MAG TPA: CPBP family intramembrane glutamic endopeptidase [Dactylosporangium sp.]|jgi:membrane protease YdiL (CAAX protease family)|nr:CPBP family intramembrane glutamic endopeptidase [Dactylosporangium sp.]